MCTIGTICIFYATEGRVIAFLHRYHFCAGLSMSNRVFSYFWISILFTVFDSIGSRFFPCSLQLIFLKYWKFNAQTYSQRFKEPHRGSLPLGGGVEGQWWAWGKRGRIPFLAHTIRHGPLGPIGPYRHNTAVSMFFRLIMSPIGLIIT